MLSSHNCSIRPVWMLFQRKIDDVLDRVRLADLCRRRQVRVRVGPATVQWSTLTVALDSSIVVRVSIRRDGGPNEAATSRRRSSTRCFAIPIRRRGKASAATRGDTDHARWELRTRAALG